jgi:hypothetical protein
MKTSYLSGYVAQFPHVHVHTLDMVVRTWRFATSLYFTPSGAACRL